MKLYIIIYIQVDVHIEICILLQSCISYISIEYKLQISVQTGFSKRRTFWLCLLKSEEFWFAFRHIFFSTWNRVIRKSISFSVCSDFIFRTVSPLMVTRWLPQGVPLLHLNTSVKERQSFLMAHLKALCFLGWTGFTWNMSPCPEQYCDLEKVRFWCA